MNGTQEQTKTFEYPSRIVAKSKRDGWILIDMRLHRLSGEFQTTEHETVTDPLQFAASGSQWLRRNSIDCHSGGQMLDVLLGDDVTPVAPWTRESLALLHSTWKACHLNGMKAGCAHQEVVYETETLPCEASGYRYGHGWLMEPLTETALADIEQLRGLMTDSEMWR